MCTLLDDIWGTLAYAIVCMLSANLTLACTVMGTRLFWGMRPGGIVFLNILHLIQGFLEVIQVDCFGGKRKDTNENILN